MKGGDRSTSLSVLLYEGDGRMATQGDKRIGMNHFSPCRWDKNDAEIGAQTPYSEGWRGMRNMNGGATATHAASRFGGPCRSLSSQCLPTRSGSGLPKGVAKIYDPLSSRWGGRVVHNAELGQAVVNTAHLFEEADRMRRRPSSFVFRGTDSCDEQPYLYSKSRSASQRVCGASAFGCTEALPANHAIRPRRIPPARDELGLVLLEDDVPLPLSPGRPHGSNGAAGGGSSSSGSSPFALVTIQPPEGPQKRGSKLRETQFARQSEEPVAWRPERTASNAHRDCSEARGASSSRALFPRLGWQDGDEMPISPGPTLHHKQLTEAFYGNYSGGMLAQEAYLYFVSDINRRQLGGGKGVSRRPQQTRKLMGNRRKKPDVACASHGRGAGYMWSTDAASQAKWV
ncbi:hypothetical protein MOQ_002129 [Trypanosoma cruzi marinkellei]|uniref:Uncharacterized protein n=1 Tax=Trypanosoma cruzi marinkellei TaxID=85056 RepID=K2NRU3_TRYCR|nr:hypothetical protein MOQ_002129 [Trypanosoma cruzi marinkellei]